MANKWDLLSEKVMGKATEVVRAAIIETENRIIQGSVVDKGFFINSWMTSIGTPIDSREVASMTGADALTQAVQVTMKLESGDTVYFTSNLPYSFRLEYDGHSTRMPHGTLRKNLAEFPEILKQKAREMKK